MAGAQTIPAKMTAVAISQPGGPMVLKPEKRDVPQPGPGEILIRVHAAGVNRPDLLQRKGAYPPPAGASDLPGLEVAGEVAALGEDAARWRVGDQVCGADGQCVGVFYDLDLAHHLPPRMRMARQARPSRARRSLAAVGPSVPAA